MGAVSAWCEVRAAERAGGLQIGPRWWRQGGGLGAKRGPVGGSCECLVRSEGSRKGKGGVCWDRVVEAERAVSGPRGGQLVGVVSAWCQVRATEGAGGLRIGPGWWR